MAYIYPTRNIEDILKLLKSAGLSHCCLALESGSERINKEVFRRVYNRDHLIRTARLCKELGIEFYTDVITYNPYEEEDDLRKTLEVLMEMKGGFGMAVNKLYVLPGTEIADKMERDGVKAGVSGKDSMFDYYCRLFWIASFTRHCRPIINMIDKVGVFRQYPRMLSPAIVEAFVSPLSFTRALVRQMLPKAAIKTLQAWRARIRHRGQMNVVRAGHDNTEQ